MALAEWKRDYLARCYVRELQPLPQIATVIGANIETVKRYVAGGHDAEFDRKCEEYALQRVEQRTDHEAWLWGLGPRCRTAVERSLEDEKDPHKAADRAQEIFYQLMPEQRPRSEQNDAPAAGEGQATLTRQDDAVLKAVVAIRDTVKDLRSLGEVHDSPHVHTGPSAAPRPALAEKVQDSQEAVIEVVQDEIDFGGT